MKIYLYDNDSTKEVIRIRKNSNGTTLVTPAPVSDFGRFGQQQTVTSGRLYLPDWRRPNPPKFPFATL